MNEDVRTAWYEAADEHGFGDPNAVDKVCAPPAGTVSNGRNRDDADASIYPGDAADVSVHRGATCTRVGYHLATLHSAGENSWLVSTAYPWPTHRWWVGFNDRASEGNWVWVDGAPVTYTNQAGGEPNTINDDDGGQVNRFHPNQT